MFNPHHLARSARVILMFLALSLIGCTKPDPTSVPILVRPPEMTGAWNFSGSGGLSIAFLVVQRGTSFSGDCQISAGGGSIIGSVYGHCTYPKITYSIVIPGYYDIDFSGQMIGEQQVSGVLNGSGFTNYPISGNRR